MRKSALLLVSLFVAPLAHAGFTLEWGGDADVKRERINKYEASGFRSLAELLPQQRELIQRHLPQSANEIDFQNWAAKNDALAATFLAITQALARTEVTIQGQTRPMLDFVREIKRLEGDRVRATLDGELFSAWRADPQFKIVMPDGKIEEGRAKFKEGTAIGCASLHKGYKVQAYTSCNNVPRIQINYRPSDHEADIDLDGYPAFQGIFPNPKHLTFDNSDVRMWRDTYLAKFGNPGFTMRPNSAIGGSKLGNRFQTLLDAPQTPPSSSATAYVSARTFVFAEGFINEWLPKYFDDNEDVLRQELGLQSSFHLQESSANHTKNNGKIFVKKLRQLYRDGGNRPIVILAHSKGATEAMLALMQEPQLIRDGIVERVVSIQGAIRGTAFADLATVCKAPPPPPMPNQPPVHPTCMENYGLLSLQPEEAYITARDALKKLKPEDRALIAQRIHWVRSVSAFTQTAPFLKLTGLALERYGAHDGIVNTADQWLGDLAPEIGIDMGILDADHTDLTCAAPVSHLPRTYRRAFTVALIEELVRSLE